jgi:uncharacterized protein
MKRFMADNCIAIFKTVNPRPFFFKRKSVQPKRTLLEKRLHPKTLANGNKFKQMVAYSIMELSKKEKGYLLGVAKHSILQYLEIRKKPAVKELGFFGASFVTLMKNNQLRGCIGTLDAYKDLAIDVSDNAINAAFGDPRFGPVSRNELKDLNLEVSFLTPKEIFKGKPEEFKAYINKEKCGVIIEKGWNRATFLPDVWKMIPDVNEFLSELSFKAGLNGDGWNGCDWYVYSSIAFSEDWEKIKDYK